MKPYLRLCEGLSGSKFTLADARKALGVQPSSTKVILSRLKSAGLILPVGRGRYRLIGRENLAKLQEIKERDKKMYQLVLGVYQKYHDLKALVLYGSRISGTADAFSDYDAMVITDAIHDRSDNKKIERELAEELGIKVHLAVYSKRGVMISAMTEPHLKFWMNNAVVLAEDRWPTPLPPTAKWGYKEALYMAEGYIDVGGEDQGSFRVTCYLLALKLILMVEHALKLDYDYENVRKEMEYLVGKNTVLAVRRDHLSPKGVRKKQIEKLGRIVRKRLKELRNKLDLIGENESDLRWKEMRG
ncbi:MAG: nucleotidyltransferase domain-containing protein [Candidatus Hadarchaeota archaeon]